MYDVPYLLVNCFSIGYNKNYKGMVGNFFIIIVKFYNTICLISSSLWFYTNKNINFLYNKAANLFLLVARKFKISNIFNKDGIFIV